jgi:hypothetical protein
MFRKLGHLQAIKLCNEYEEGNYEHKVLYKEIGYNFLTK